MPVIEIHLSLGWDMSTWHALGAQVGAWWHAADAWCATHQQAASGGLMLGAFGLVRASIAQTGKPW